MSRLLDAVRLSKWGLLSLTLVNLSACFTGVSLGFGWLSGTTAVVFGPPGVVALLLLNALFSVL